MNTEQGSSPGKIKLNRTKLKNLRKNMGYSQEAMADKCRQKRIRVSISSIKRAESGHSVNYRTARELALFFGVEIAALGEDPKEHPVEKTKLALKINVDKASPALLPENCTLALLFLSLYFSSFRNHSKQPLQQCIQIAEKHGGEIHQQLGNSLLIVFDSGQSLSPVQCATAALEMEQNLKRCSKQMLHFYCRLHLIKQPEYSGAIQPSLTIEQKLQPGISDWDTIFDCAGQEGDCRVIASNEIKEATDTLFSYQPLITITQPTLYPGHQFWRLRSHQQADNLVSHYGL
ncbi:helix-turn-helix transcriptional regulator [Motiliproteus sp. MSK22-1]|uniref:helix-turn-helix domain-containing protein n=1 Tax=Motiliproteus sp. MSK22-1 TaxID=1897630 RepID=UPI0009782D39|nr:helix-turn-helix transcriptional regulator [Motiliproteus sp. MSK22-1]OMH36559.1 hypothetical protein BGP75_09410 [Motiliproteus sp. MSK22-1]